METAMSGLPHERKRGKPASHRSHQSKPLQDLLPRAGRRARKHPVGVELLQRRLADFEPARLLAREDEGVVPDLRLLVPWDVAVKQIAPRRRRRRAKLDLVVVGVARDLLLRNLSSAAREPPLGSEGADAREPQAVLEQVRGAPGRPVRRRRRVRRRLPPGPCRRRGRKWRGAGRRESRAVVASAGRWRGPLGAAPDSWRQHPAGRGHPARTRTSDEHGLARGPLRTKMASRLWTSWKPSWASWGLLGSWAVLGLGVFFGPSWRPIGPTWGIFAAHWAVSQAGPPWMSGRGTKPDR